MKKVTSFLLHGTQKPVWTSGNFCQPQVEHESVLVRKSLLLNRAHEAEIYHNQPWLPLWWQMSQLDLPQTILEWLSGILHVGMCQQSFSNTRVFCLCFPSCFPCHLHHLVLSSVTLNSDLWNCGAQLIPFREKQRDSGKMNILVTFFSM